MTFFTNKMDWKSKKGKTIVVLISLSVLLPLIGNAISNRKYPSLEQADFACEAWADKGGRINYFKYQYGISSYALDRDCLWEQETRQVLGRQGYFKTYQKEKEGKLIETYSSFPSASKLIVVKNFRY